ncbi:MAG: Hsp20/alpha crystallin family protein [Deltaproteobacteria bacterium]|nr:Hsp20/alpha crystallin family protein [Deltaproteobacteria bacterium]
MSKDGSDVELMAREVQRRIQKIGRDAGPASIADDLPAVACDLVETDDAFHLTADLPGFEAENIRVAVEPRRITITARPKPTEIAQTDRHAVMVERTAGQLMRTVDLPFAVDERSVETRYVSGVLSVRLAKAAT